MWPKELFWSLFIFANVQYYTNGCSIPGLPSSPGILSLSVKDIDRGVIHRVTTQNIISITASGHSGDELRNGPYITAALENDDFILSLHENFEHYEEHEITTSMGFTVNFLCNGNPSNFIVIVTLDVIDTNNNEPIFTPVEVSFTTPLPLPPGFKVTGCNNQIVVRDIDLTTTAIIFDIEENDYFEILFDEVSTVPNTKTFLGIVRTKSLVRSIPNPITLWISATDVDRTGNPPHTTITSMTIKGDPSFTPPADLIFTQPFYLASYTEDHQLTLQQEISLREGFDEEVTFTLTGDLVTHFQLTGTDNNKSLEVILELPVNVLLEQSQILLVVTAERQHVASTTATIVIKLPQTTGILFNNLHYEGTIVDNTLTAPNLILKQGYEEGFEVEIISDYAEYFDYRIFERNVIQLQMTQLTEDILIKNNFITLQVKASSEHGYTLAIVILDIIKDDLTTPIFGQNTYTGTFDRENGLRLEEIILVQGYDDTVEFDTEGEHGDIFSISSVENKVILTPNIPSDILQDYNRLVLTVVASKPRTVGARSTVIVSLPSDMSTSIRFDSLHYEGQIVDNNLSAPNLILKEGYEDSFDVEIISDYSDYFEYTIVERNQIQLQMTELTGDILINNNFITLQVKASSEHGYTLAIVTLDIIKDDLTTPIFGQNTYTGTYDRENALRLEEIILVQGYDDTVEFDTDGEHGDIFSISSVENKVILTPNIPSDILQDYNRLVLTVVASKPRTVGARSTVIVSLPSDMSTSIRFDSLHYEGQIVDNNLSAPNLILKEGYEDSFDVEIISDYSDYFEYTIVERNQIQLQMTELTGDILINNNFITLQVKASSEHGYTLAIVTLDIIKDDLTTPIFGQNTYTGTYDRENALRLEEIILVQGYDDTVEFDTDGEHGDIFSISSVENKVILTPNIPSDILQDYNRLVLTVVASKPRTVGARSTVIVSLPSDMSTSIRFDSLHYEGQIVDNNLSAPNLILKEGYEDSFDVEIISDYSDYFEYTIVERNQIQLQMTELTGDILINNNFITLQVKASSEHGYTLAIVTLDIIKDDLTTPIFGQNTYTGTYDRENALRLEEIILVQGYDDTVEFDTDGEHGDIFSISSVENKVILTPNIPSDILQDYNRLVLTVVASKPRTVGARSTVIVSLPSDMSTSIRFDSLHYEGQIVDNNLSAPNLILKDGYEDSFDVEIISDYSDYFEYTIVERNQIQLQMTELTGDILIKNNFITLQVKASSEHGYTLAIVTLDIIKDDLTTPIFGQNTYTGTYDRENALRLEEIILVQGYDDTVEFDTDGEHGDIFSISSVENKVILTPNIPSDILQDYNRLVLTVVASKPRTVGARSTVIVSLPSDMSTSIRFDSLHYEGQIVDNNLSAPNLILKEGYEDSFDVEIISDYSDYFEYTIVERNQIQLQMTELTGDILINNNFITLQVKASSEHGYTLAIVTLDIIKDDLTTPIFGQNTYTGTYDRENALRLEEIILVQGYDDTVEFDTGGEHGNFFSISSVENKITFIPNIPSEILQENNQLIFTVVASKPRTVGARSTVIVSLPTGPSSEIFFSRALYHGTYELGTLRHDEITLVGYSGSEIELRGDWSELFKGVVDNGLVHIEVVDDTIIPVELLNVALELRADVATSAIAIDFQHRDESVPPAVVFNPQSYVFRVDVTETGIIGIVSAVTNNGETVQYSLEVDNDHLNERLSVSSRGEIHLTALANPGRYHFNIIATTSTSGVTATADAQLTVDAITVCGEDEFVVPPLIIIERDEEEPHDNLVVVNDDIADKCHYEMSNRWPIDQTWLTVDDVGLHANAIDREDESIALMPVSQIQVELILHCADDNVKRTKRSTYNNISNSSKMIIPNEYGTKKWIITDPIVYNSRRTFVNLIVNDINDNSPIFIGKEIEPIVVGYPKLDLLDIVRPRALAELQATDKDIGINAKLVYWSDASILAVARETGIVHVRNNMADLLQDNTEYIVRATDKDGAPDGNDGSIRILVKILDVYNIAVLTIRDAFLDSEQKILNDISENLNYEVRSLRSTVISAEFVDAEESYRKRRDTAEVSFRDGGASLELYVYGLVDNTPIGASQLVTDINNSGITTVKIVNNIILEDHLESDIGHDVGLLAATITLSVILFLIIVFAVFWYFYKIRRANNYEEFDDTKSLSNHSNVDAEIPKIENIARAKINIDEIKKSERRLQDILNTPLEDKNNAPHSSMDIIEVSSETIIDIPVVEKNAPIVIQSIDKLKDAHDSDDEDEFGELKNNPRRKSVVTFNENVEKIIHVEDDIDDTESVPDYEVNKL